MSYTSLSIISMLFLRSVVLGKNSMMILRASMCPVLYHFVPAACRRREVSSPGDGTPVSPSSHRRATRRS